LGGVTRRIAIFVTFVVAAMLAAGIFGAFHNQLSYSISQEYFTQFKFVQFRLLDFPLPERVRAAVVGFRASWWMGVPLGLLTGLAGFLYPGVEQMRRALALSLPLICGFVLLVALVGLAYGMVQTSGSAISKYVGQTPPADIGVWRRFICVGYMHNAAYLGGAAAIPSAWLFHILNRRRSRTPSQQPHEAIGSR
jgi:hypothetical protein